VIESPGSWPDRQRAFHQEYDRDPESLPRQRVVWQIVAAPAAVELLSALNWRDIDPPVLGVWREHAPLGEPAMLIFEVESLPAEGQGSGVVVGEAAPNGALCIELPSGLVLWPTYNPRVPTLTSPKRGDAPPAYVPAAPPPNEKEVLRGIGVALTRRLVLVAATALTAWWFFALRGGGTIGEEQARRDAEGYSTSEKLFLLGVALIVVLGAAEVAWRRLRYRQRPSR